jgi:hypothetical protein
LTPAVEVKRAMSNGKDLIDLMKGASSHLKLTVKFYGHIIGSSLMFGPAVV